MLVQKNRCLSVKEIPNLSMHKSLHILQYFIDVRYQFIYLHISVIRNELSVSVLLILEVSHAYVSQKIITEKNIQRWRPLTSWIWRYGMFLKIISHERCRYPKNESYIIKSNWEIKSSMKNWILANFWYIFCMLYDIFHQFWPE